MRRISFVVAPEFELFDLSGPLCAFEMARDLCSAPYQLDVVSAEGERIGSSGGVTMCTQWPTDADGSDTVIVVGGPKAHVAGRQPRTTRLLEALKPSTRRMASVCTGAFYLAEAGVLDDRRATTHWRHASLLGSRFPRISVEMDRIFVRDGNVWTSAGISAGVDLALAMLEADFGSELSKTVAREMVVSHRRTGGQSQFSTLLAIEPGSGRVRDAVVFAREHLQEDLSVERLADAARISSRQFARIFVKETGETPARAIERMRAEAARDQVEDGPEPIEVIARKVGFGDIERMRRTFLKLFGQSPQALRRSARAYATALHSGSP